MWITTETSHVFDMRGTHVKHMGHQDLPRHPGRYERHHRGTCTRGTNNIRALHLFDISPVFAGVPRYGSIMRSFSSASVLDDTGLTLELAPALTPRGLTEVPAFFSGFAAQPLVLARGLLVLADVAQTR